MKWLITSAVILLLSCELYTTNKRYEEFEETLGPLVGKVKKEYIYGRYGQPEKRTRIEHSEYWHYYFPSQLEPSILHEDPLQQMDYLRIEFDSSGIFRSWEATRVVRNTPERQ